MSLADEYCCALLQGINFETNLPVVIADTGGKTVNRDDQQSRVCTCSTGLEKGDVNMTAVFRVRGGTNSRKLLASESPDYKPHDHSFIISDCIYKAMNGLGCFFIVRSIDGALGERPDCVLRDAL